MLGFIEFLNERIKSWGFNPDKAESDRAERRQHHKAMIKTLQGAYKDAPGGYGGLGSGTHAERRAIGQDVRNAAHIKATTRQGKLTSVVLYKSQHGRKGIALGGDGTRQGSRDLKNTVRSDHTQERAWYEVSDKPLIYTQNLGHPKVPASKAKHYVKKDDVTPTGEYTYKRKIGGHEHEKTIVGHPKD